MAGGSLLFSAFYISIEIHWRRREGKGELTREEEEGKGGLGRGERRERDGQSIHLLHKAF